MSLARKFIIIILVSILFIAIVNIAAFYIFYTTYLKVYLAEKIGSRKEITIDYINDIIQKQTIENIDNIFSDAEIEFFDLLERSNQKIKLDKQENVDIVVNYLVKSGVAPKYIEQIIPKDNFKEIISKIKDKKSPEYRFFNRLTKSILVTNFIALIILFIIIGIFIRKTIMPIKQATKKIKTLQPGKNNIKIQYNNKDEIGLLINAINGLNEKLKIQKKIRSRLLADISHELKTPITSIQCYLEGIADGVIKLDNKNLGAITDEMKRLISLVNRIMTYERFENQKLELNKQKYNVANIIKEVVETHKNNLKENKQRIKITGDESLEKEFDKNLFKQVIHNLIGNFLKYAGKYTILTINITKNYIDFKDNGKGVKASEVEFLTEKFYQANDEKSGDAEKRGIGVGLSLVDKIIQAHNWKISIKSDIGKGFSFKIYY